MDFGLIVGYLLLLGTIVITVLYAREAAKDAKAAEQTCRRVLKTVSELRDQNKHLSHQRDRLVSRLLGDDPEKIRQRLRQRDSETRPLEIVEAQSNGAGRHRTTEHQETAILSPVRDDRPTEQIPKITDQ